MVRAFATLAGLFIIGVILLVLLKIFGILIIAFTAIIATIIFAIPGLLILFAAGLLLFTGFGTAISIITAVIGFIVLVLIAPISVPFVFVILMAAFFLKNRDDNLRKQFISK
jgi:hypothetical protein